MIQSSDSADELTLEHLATLDLSKKRILIINESRGVLSQALRDFDVSSYTDSFLEARYIKDPITQLSTLTGIYDLVVIKIPKNLSFFEDILCHLSHHLQPESQVICGYRVKHQANGSFDLLNRLIGTTATSLAKKKARLIFAKFERNQVTSPFPLRHSVQGLEQGLIHHSNLFSCGKLDIGTRFFLENIPVGNFKTILDLGCGDGILGIVSKKKNPLAKLIFCDESVMALDSARANYARCFENQAQFLWTDCYSDSNFESVDLILCNPPFHQGTSLSDSTSRQMFKDARRALNPGGIIRVIGNHHLKYPHILKSLFGNSRIIASNQKFLIVDATRSGA